MKKKPKTFIRYRLKLWCKSHVAFIVAFFIVLLIPLITVVGFVIAKRQCAIKPDGLLTYFAATFGVLITVYSLTENKLRIEEMRLNSIAPRLTIDVNRAPENESKNLFTVTVTNIGKEPVSEVFLSEFKVKSVIKPGGSEPIRAAFNMNQDDEDTLRAAFNMNQDDEDTFKPVCNIVGIKMVNGFPSYIHICCDDVDGNTWDCLFNKMDNDTYYRERPLMHGN